MRSSVARLTILVLAIACSAPVVLAQGICDGVSPVNNTTLTSVQVATNLTRPLFITSPPGDTDRIFIVEQDGVIRVKHRGTGLTGYTTYLDISVPVNSAGNEQGLLGLAFHPNFGLDTGQNQFFYVNYTDSSGDQQISRFNGNFGGDPDVANPTSERPITRIPEPESNHNGGWIAFGPNDGYLYISTGDGGGGEDEHGACGNGQSTSTLLGKMLRIDIDNQAANGAADCGSGTYKVPADNPFVGVAGCDEIWAYGLRNAWRNSFDPVTGDLYMGDVGQYCWEEINWQSGASTGGENYGWRQMEGFQCFDHNAPPGSSCNPASAPDCSPACNDPSLTDPIVDFASTGACSAVGGYVYRGCRMPNFDGKYFYGDYCDGRVISVEVVGGVATNSQSWTGQVGPGFGLMSFGVDAQGEMYIGDQSPGEVRKILPPLPDFEVSGLGADNFLLSINSPWSWEDLEFNSMHPLTDYRIYRDEFPAGIYDPGAVFNLIHTQSTTTWGPVGDGANPPAGELWAYVVTARNASLQETSPGGTPTRTLNP